MDPTISRLDEKKASRGMVSSAFGSGWPTHIQCGNGTVYVVLKNTRFLTERTFECRLNELPAKAWRGDKGDKWDGAAAART